MSLITIKINENDKAKISKISKVIISAYYILDGAMILFCLWLAWYMNQLSFPIGATVPMSAFINLATATMGLGILVFIYLLFVMLLALTPKNTLESLLSKLIKFEKIPRTE